MLSRELIKSEEKTYEEKIKELEEQIKFFTNKSQRLEKENKRLQERIDKAIEYINNWKCFECEKGTVRELSFESNKETLLSILQDKE